MKILSFKTEEMLIDKINDLKIDGIAEDRLKIISKKDLTSDYFKKFSGIIEKKSTKSGSISNFLSGGFPTPDLERYGLDQKDRIDYEEEISNDNYILIIEEGDL